MGLPSSILYSQKNFRVIGYDLDKNLIKKLNKSNNDVNGVKVNQIKKFLKKKFLFFSDFRKVINADIYIICLPTPLKILNPTYLILIIS